MKKLLQLIIIIITINLSAQEYSFGIVSDYNNTGNVYEFTLVATPDFTNASPNMADIQFSMAITTGNSIQAGSFTELLGSGWQVNTALNGSILQNNFGVGDGSKDLWLFTLPVPTTALTTPHASGVEIPLVSFIVDNAPTDGLIEVLENTDPIATALAGIGFVVDNAINIDLGSGDGTQNYYGNTSANNSFSFSTLSIETQEIEITDIILYPNPATDVVFIKGNTNNLRRIEVFNVAGQRVLVKENNLNNFDVRELESAVYIVKLHTDRAYKTIQIIKK